MASKVVIFGSAGQLGIELTRSFRARGYAVTGLTRADVDITDSARSGLQPS
jgi:dTDP-4-dehydrorhamnose reductase